MSPGGTSLYSDADFTNASDASLIGNFGVGDFNPVQLDKMLSGKIIKAETFIDERSEGIEGFATPKGPGNRNAARLPAVH